MDTPHARRMVTMSDYEYADLVDDQDKIHVLISPESTYGKAAAIGRAMDDEIIDALGGTAKLVCPVELTQRCLWSENRAWKCRFNDR